MAALVMLSAAVLLALLLPSFMAVAHNNNILYANDTLNTNQSLREENYTLTMQVDCNLGLYDNDQEVWSSNTAGPKNCYALLQTNGDFVIFNHEGEVVWTSNTSGPKDRYIVVVHRDGYVVIYHPIWIRPETNTVKRGITAADEPTNRKITMVTYN